MDSNILLDTSVLIDLQRGEEKTVKLFDNIKIRVSVSRVTACEFIYGAENKKVKQINKSFLESLPIIEINKAISKYTYFLLDKYSLEVKLGIANALIAATAIVEDLSFWTLNKRHFKKIKELKLFKS